MLALLAITVSGCVPFPDPGNDNSATPAYNNTTDPTNAGAFYLGSAACGTCHADVADVVRLHGHTHILTPIEGQPPSYPPEADRADVPQPPAGSTWNDVAFVLGGYTRTARFIDRDGYLLTDDRTGVNTQWNLEFEASGTQPAFVPYENAGRFSPANPKAFGFDCFTCHVTGPQPADSVNPEHQQNRPGIAGTWQEAGVRCEACHGPGANHVGNPFARDLYVNDSAAFCGKCHNHEFNSNNLTIRATDGYIIANAQYVELRASGGHAEFKCTTCHDPHASTNFDRANSHIRECRDCHADQTMALHAGVVYARGDYVEALSCESCHMPLATVSGSPATDEVTGGRGRIGDTHTHIFRIRAAADDFTTMFNAELTEVVKDSAGRAAVTVDFVCLRCHNGQGSAFPLTIRSAGQIAAGMHDLAE